MLQNVDKLRQVFAKQLPQKPVNRSRANVSERIIQNASGCRKAKICTKPHNHQKTITRGFLNEIARLQL